MQLCDQTKDAPVHAQLPVFCAVFRLPNRSARFMRN